MNIFNRVAIVSNLHELLQNSYKHTVSSNNMHISRCVAAFRNNHSSTRWRATFLHTSGSVEFLLAAGVVGLDVEGRGVVLRGALVIFLPRKKAYEVRRMDITHKTKIIETAPLERDCPILLDRTGAWHCSIFPTVPNDHVHI